VHKYEISVLGALKGRGSESLEAVISASGVGRDEARWAIENLKAKGLVEVSYSQDEVFELTAEGKLYAKEGLPEVNLVAEVKKGEVKTVSELKNGSDRIGFQWAKEKGWIKIENGELKLTQVGGDHKIMQIKVEKLDKSEQIKRKLGVSVIKRAVTGVSITKKGISALKEGKADEELIDSIDRNMIASAAWEGKKFKKYDVNITVERRIPAMRHPIKKLIEDLKDAYISMGYKEISGPAVESSFWVFDSLFVPQDHPARDAQDTFYVSNLESETFNKVPYVRTVKRAHEKGWHTKWREDVAGQMMLRTHTTSISSRYLYGIINELKENLPIKLFSIGRVFRNETVDYRHLADFYQHDGLIIGKNLTVSNLFDELIKIYDFLGIKIKFKPSYFPFVEPGVEFMAYSEKAKGWIELGGAGMIREEITGVKRNKLSVLAWGPGIDRILLIKDPTISNISELYNSNLGWARNRKGI